MAITVTRLDGEGVTADVFDAATNLEETPVGSLQLFAGKRPLIGFAAGTWLMWEVADG